MAVEDLEIKTKICKSTGIKIPGCEKILPLECFRVVDKKTGRHQI